jgi:hypothetical protein
MVRGVGGGVYQVFKEGFFSRYLVNSLLLSYSCDFLCFRRFCEFVSSLVYHDLVPSIPNYAKDDVVAFGVKAVKRGASLVPKIVEIWMLFRILVISTWVLLN